MNTTAEYDGQQIHLKWAKPLQDECQEIKTFIIKWNSIQKPEECNGNMSIKVRNNRINVLILEQVRD